MKKRADGRYQKSVTIGIADDGKLIRKLVYAKTQKELQEKELALKGLIQNGIIIKDDMSFGEAVSIFLKEKEKYKENTQKSYKNSVAKLKPLYPSPVSKLKAVHLRQILQQIESPSVARKVCQTAKAVMQMLLEDDVIPKNPFMSVPTPKDQQKTIRRALTEDEQKLIYSAPTTKEKVMTLLMLCCGLRISEAFAVSLRDIDFEKRIVNVSKQSPSFGVYIAPKSKTSVRAVPVPSFVLTEIKKLNSLTLAPFFSSQTERNELMHKYFSSLGLPSEITSHYLRHTYATLLYESGVDVLTAKSYLGHASIQMTMDVYTHLSDQKKISESSKLDAYLLTKID